MHFPTLCVDDFYEDVDAVRKFALQQEFKASPTGQYPGTRTERIHLLNRSFFDSFCSKLFSLYYDVNDPDLKWEVTSYFQMINIEESEGWIHHDDDSLVAGVIYLTPDANIDSGTSIFKIKDKNKYDEYQELKHEFYLKNTIDLQKYNEVKQEQESNFVETIRFNNVYNRMICYEGSQYHKANKLNAGSEFRLTQTFFVNRVEVKYTPIGRMRSIQTIV